MGKKLIRIGFDNVHFNSQCESQCGCFDAMTMTAPFSSKREIVLVSSASQFFNVKCNALLVSLFAKIEMCVQVCVYVYSESLTISYLLYNNEMKCACAI